MMRTCLAISFGAIGGALSRYYITYWFTQKFGTNFPYGTFCINITGCFLMGIFVTLANEKFNISPDVKLLVTTGFLGAYTTFSTYGLDTIKLLENQGAILVTGFYWLGSTVLGVLAVYLGVICGRLV